MFERSTFFSPLEPRAEASREAIRIKNATRRLARQRVRIFQRYHSSRPADSRNIHRPRRVGPSYAALAAIGLLAKTFPQATSATGGGR
jgi:hypothetical protein